MAIASIIKLCLEFRMRLKISFDRNKPPITLLEPPDASLRPARADYLGVMSAPETSAVCVTFLALLTLKDMSLIIAVVVSVV